MTRYFTFGQAHMHLVNGKTFDQDTVVEITSENPRGVMFALFGAEWAFEYDEMPDMNYYKRLEKI